MGGAQLIIPGTQSIDTLRALNYDFNYNPSTNLLTVSNLTVSGTTTISGYAPLASPSFTGTPTAPTAVSGTNTTQIATTAFVQTAVAGIVTTVSGTIQMWPTASAPSGYLLCNGSIVNIVQYPDLYQALGSSYLVSGSSTQFTTPTISSPVSGFVYIICIG